MSYCNLNIYFLVFLQAYYLLNTSLKTVPEIHAYDKDTGINQTINYKIHKGLLDSFFFFFLFIIIKIILAKFGKNLNILTLDDIE